MKILQFILLSILSFPLSANIHSDLLSQEDYQLQMRESLRPIMTSMPNDIDQWKSYNQWNCYPTHIVSYECAVYSDSITVPSLHITLNNHTYEFDVSIPDKEYTGDCDDVQAEWETLIHGSKEVCIFAAYMPGVDEENYPSDWSLWYAVKIKTENGYWKIQNGFYD